MEVELAESRLLEAEAQVPGQSVAVRVDRGLQAPGGYKPDNLDDVRIDKGLAAGDGHRVAVGDFLTGDHVRKHVFESPMTLQPVPVAAATGQVAPVADFNPAPGIVGACPRKPVERPTLDAGGRVRGGRHVRY
jgi:hypothetical protein